MALLEVNGISKRFDATDVLKDISFAVEKGQALAIIGSCISGWCSKASTCSRSTRPCRT